MAEFKFAPPGKPCVRYAAYDRHLVRLVNHLNDDVVAVYRVGSCVEGGSPRPDSDIDYLVLHNRDQHSPYAYAAFSRESPKEIAAGKVTIRGPLRDPNYVWIHSAHLTRRDLQNPAGMSALHDKLGFLLGVRQARRELVQGEDLLPKWLSPEFDNVCAAHGVVARSRATRPSSRKE